MHPTNLDNLLKYLSDFARHERLVDELGPEEAVERILEELERGECHAIESPVLLPNETLERIAIEALRKARGTRQLLGGPLATGSSMPKGTKGKEVRDLWPTLVEIDGNQYRLSLADKRMVLLSPSPKGVGNLALVLDGHRYALTSAPAYPDCMVINLGVRPLQEFLQAWTEDPSQHTLRFEAAIRHPDTDEAERLAEVPPRALAASDSATIRDSSTGIHKSWCTFIDSSRHKWDLFADREGRIYVALSDANSRRAVVINSIHYRLRQAPDGLVEIVDLFDSDLDAIATTVNEIEGCWEDAK